MHDSRALLRARMSLRRRELEPRQRIAAAAGVLRSLESLPAFRDGNNIAGYWAVHGELPLNLVVAALQRRGQHYFLPRLGAARHLDFVEFQQGDSLANNRFGIPEPDATPDRLRPARELDVILLPLLAFDRRGHRLGSGGGWYDTSLAFLHTAPRPAAPVLVGVGYAFQQVPAIRTESWDVPLDCVATEEELIACAATAPR